MRSAHTSEYMVRLLLNKYPDYLLKSIAALAATRKREVYVVGGTVRDLLDGVRPRDLDLAVDRGALEFARELAADISGTFVLLDAKEDTARVVWHDYIVDVAGFRGNPIEIEEDLVKRDFTINALAVPFALFQQQTVDNDSIIDPAGGLDDLCKGIIRVLNPACFVDDPLRLLRTFRFYAETGFIIEPRTWQWVKEHGDLVQGVSPERISYELDCIMATRCAFEAFSLLQKVGLLHHLFPELILGEGVGQPASHHLDVMAHNLEALRWMEKIVERPGRFYPAHGSSMADYLATGSTKIWLNWAALFHDLGKPDACRLIKERITFYNHDRIGADIFRILGKRMRWSKEKTERISRFISLHMWPFHLSNVRRKSGVTAKACLKLYKAVRRDLPGLFLLAMADSLAGQGPGKPEAMEEELAALYNQVVEVCKKEVEPVLAGPSLLNGRDLIALGLTPGPLFTEILSALEKAQVAGEVKSREQALEWVRNFYPIL